MRNNNIEVLLKPDTYHKETHIMKKETLAVVISAVLLMTACNQTNSSSVSEVEQTTTTTEATTVSTTEATTEYTTEATAVVHEYTADEALSALEQYYKLNVETYDFDAYYDLCYPEDIREKTRTRLANQLTSQSGVDRSDLDLEEYLKVQYDNTYNALSNKEYEIYGCVAGGTEEEAEAAFELYYAGSSTSSHRDSDYWLEQSKSILAQYYGNSSDDYGKVFVFSSRFTRFNEVRCVYEYNGQLYVCDVSTDVRIIIN